MAEGAPPHSNLNPLRAIFVIPNKPAPTLADPDQWSPEMLDFVRCCCQKDPNQRHDSALLSSHPFVKQEVIALRSLHEEDGSLSKLCATAKYSRQAKNINQAAGLPPLQRLVTRMRRIQDAKNNNNDSPKDSDDSANNTAAAGSNTFGTAVARNNNKQIAAAAPNLMQGYFSPDSEQYKAAAKKELEVDPALQQDEVFFRELQKLARTFETKLEALQAAHELAQQRLVAEAKLRNSMPLDVSSLMNKAAERNTKSKASKAALADAAGMCFMEGVVLSSSSKRGRHKRLSSSPPSAMVRPNGLLAELGSDAGHVRSHSADNLMTTPIL